jgi:hypothetical protein
MESNMAIKRSDLYTQRIKEINNLDMMAPQQIADHPESIIEFQILSLCIIGQLNKFLNFHEAPKSSD